MNAYLLTYTHAHIHTYMSGVGFVDMNAYRLIYTHKHIHTYIIKYQIRRHSLTYTHAHIHTYMSDVGFVDMNASRSPSPPVNYDTSRSRRLGDGNRRLSDGNGYNQDDDYDDPYTQSSHKEVGVRVCMYICCLGMQCMGMWKTHARTHIQKLPVYIHLEVFRIICSILSAMFV
jgi:hypothetical protein